MRELRARLESIEMDRRRDLEAWDISELEDEEQREEVAPMQETPNLQIYYGSDLKDETGVSYL